MLVIGDAGPGAPMELCDRLSQPFVPRSPGGTGLGLTIAARVMQASWLEPVKKLKLLGLR